MVVGTGFMPLFLKHMSAEKAWRTVSLIPAGMAIVTGITVYFISDDIPNRQKHRRSTRRSLVMEEQKKRDGSVSKRMTMIENGQPAAISREPRPLEEGGKRSKFGDWRRRLPIAGFAEYVGESGMHTVTVRSKDIGDFDRKLRTLNGRH